MGPFVLALTILNSCLLVVALLLLARAKKRQTDDRVLEELRASRQEMQQNVQDSMRTLGTVLYDAQHTTAEMQDKRLETLQIMLTQQQSTLRGSVQVSMDKLEQQFRQLSEQTEHRLQRMQQGNESKLEEMRLTVNEKLQKTLEERISRSFALVSKNLDAVSQGLGEMKSLAGDVSGLKRVLSNVKTCGILGEIQLGAILSELLAPEQYATNVATVPQSLNRVEFAVKLPGVDDAPVYLPIDSKFPLDAYRQLTSAYESGDAEAVRQYSKQLNTRIRAFAKDIHDKYICPPYTTEFAVLFLPIESLYAEVVRSGLVEVLQQSYQISIAGPTTMAALLNSLQMGFRTLAIQKRTSEVWSLLSAVKTEFEKFETALEKTQTKLQQTSRELDCLVGTRTRAINRSLKAVTTMSDEQSRQILSAAEQEP